MVVLISVRREVTAGICIAFGGSCGCVGIQHGSDVDLYRGTGG